MLAINLIAVISTYMLTLLPSTISKEELVNKRGGLLLQLKS